LSTMSRAGYASRFQYQASKVVEMEPFEEPGSWWIPEHKSDIRGGTVRFGYGNDGITLSLIGSFQPSGSDPERRAPYAYPIILGRTSSGRLMTLEESTPTKSMRMGFEENP